MIYRGPGLSCGRMIWLIAQPFPPLYRQQVVSLSQPSCVPTVDLTDEKKGGEGGGDEELNNTTARKPVPL